MIIIIDDELIAYLKNKTDSIISFQFQRKEMPMNYGTVALISHASKVMLKILQARLQQ